MTSYNLIKAIAEAKTVKSEVDHYNSFRSALNTSKKRSKIRKHTKANASDCRQFIISCVAKNEYTSKEIANLCQSIYTSHKRSTFNTYLADLRNDKYFKNVHSQKAYVDAKTKVIHF